MRCSDEPAGDSVDLADWPFISYDPTTYPPFPQSEPLRPTLTRRLAAFGARWINLTATYICLFGAGYILSTGHL